MRYFIYTFAVILLVVSCKSNKETTNKDKDIKHSLIFVNSTPEILSTPESVCFYQKENLFFVSNINGNPTEKDLNGYISIIDTSGNIRVHKWIENLDAPKGMAIYNNFLVVADIDKIVVIDIVNKKIIDTKIIESAKFLNDVAVTKEGKFYISDMQDNKIYEFSIGQEPRLFIENELESPNGMLIVDNFLYIGNKDFILKYDFITSKLVKIFENTGPIDGLKKTGNDEFIISDWAGNVNFINSKGNKILLLSTEKQQINAADLEYVEKYNLVLIPTFFNNKVTIYKLKIED